MFESYILTIPKHLDRLRLIAPKAKLALSLDEVGPKGQNLVVYSSGIIVPPEVFQRFDYAYNFHAASHEYPGRDAHHWAAYNGATNYGAVVHFLTERVDEGDIVGSMTFGMPRDAGPLDYRVMAERAMYGLLDALSPSLFGVGLTQNGVRWGSVKRKRSDLLEMCDMRGLKMGEIERRKKAFYGFESFFPY